jgi:uroporphyrin-III C-methyltransferase
MNGALVIAAHGSRRDSGANALVRRLAEAVRARRLFGEVAVAFHQGEPRFDAVLDEITSGTVTVVPLLTSAGHYADDVLAQALARNHRFDQVRLRQTPPVGTHSGIAPLVARRVTELLREQGIARHDATLALVGHGTSRHPESRASTLQLADTLRRRRVAGEVLAGFIDDDPPVSALIESATLPHLVVVPFLIGGAHVVEDLPRLLSLDDSRLSTRDSRPNVTLDHPVGSYPGLVEIIIDLARRHPPAAPPRYRSRGVRPIHREPGAVHLVGAGPGDPGLITARGLELLRSADVVVHDRLIGPELLAEARADGLLIDAGKGPGHAAYSQKEINALLVEHAIAGKTVVRLKGGDPFVFGRGSEEVDACRAGGVEVQVVPGVSSAIAGPAAAGIPVTARGISRSFTVITGHVADEPPEQSSRAAPSTPLRAGSGRVAIQPPLSPDTLVLLMARANLSELAEQLISEGWDPATPTACIQSATTPEQRVTRATLATIAEAADRDGLEAPVVTVIGAVAALELAGYAAVDQYGGKAVSRYGGRSSP